MILENLVLAMLSWKASAERNIVNFLTDHSKYIVQTYIRVYTYIIYAYKQQTLGYLELKYPAAAAWII